jgi:hypothetical protein
MNSRLGLLYTYLKIIVPTLVKKMNKREFQQRAENYKTKGVNLNKNPRNNFIRRLVAAEERITALDD